MKASKCLKFETLMLNIVAQLKFLKTENLTENISEFFVRWTLMPSQPRSHANYHTAFSFRISGYFLFLKTSLVSQFSILNLRIFGTR